MRILKLDFSSLVKLLVKDLGLHPRSLYEKGDYFYFQFHDLLKRDQFDWKALDADTQDALSKMGILFTAKGIPLGENEDFRILAKNIKAEHLRAYAKARSEIWKTARKTNKAMEFQEGISTKICHANKKIEKAISLADITGINLIKVGICAIIELLVKEEKITIGQQQLIQKKIDNAYHLLNKAIESKDIQKIILAKNDVLRENKAFNFKFFLTPGENLAKQKVTTPKPNSGAKVPTNPLNSKPLYLEVPKKSHYSTRLLTTQNPVFTPNNAAIRKQSIPPLPSDTTKQTPPMPALTIKIEDIHHKPPGGVASPLTPPGSPSTPPRAG